MTGLLAVYLCVGVSALALAMIGILSPRRLLVRLGACVALVALLASGYFALADLLSRPKPVRLAWAERAAEDAEVIGSSFREGEAIYLWLALPGEDEPRAYRLPWSTPQAEELQQARREAEKSGNSGTVRVHRPFDAESEDEVLEPMFYAPPPTAPPPKANDAG